MTTLYRVFDDDGPGADGKRSFTIEWTGTGAMRQRGQCFRTNPEDFVRQALADGHTVVDADGTTHSPPTDNEEQT
jgi:hypothetical protein